MPVMGVGVQVPLRARREVPAIARYLFGKWVATTVHRLSGPFFMFPTTLFCLIGGGKRYGKTHDRPARVISGRPNCSVERKRELGGADET